MTDLRIPDEQTLPELTVRGIVLGALITIVFTAVTPPRAASRAARPAPACRATRPAR